MAESVHQGAHRFVGETTFQSTVNLPASTISNSQVSAAAAIAASKVVHRVPLIYAQADGSDVASATQLLFLASYDCTIVSVELRVTTAPTGGDKQFTVDIQKDTDGGGSFATILSSVITVDSSNVDDTLEAGTLSTTDLADGDALRVVVTASGSTGSQGQGLVVVVKLNEDPS